jgi:hypothetical protein
LSNPPHSNLRQALVHGVSCAAIASWNAAVVAAKLARGVDDAFLPVLFTASAACLAWVSYRNLRLVYRDLPMNEAVSNAR